VLLEEKVAKFCNKIAKSMNFFNEYAFEVIENVFEVWDNPK